MATIGALNVTLSAKTGLFARGMKTAAGTLHGFESSMSSLTGKVLGFGTAITTAVAGAAMGVLIKRSMDAIDVTAKLADSLGDTTEGITALQYAGNLAGVSAETMNKGLGLMVRKLGDARNGLGSAQQAFAGLGLDFQQLAAMRPSEAFAKISDAINALPGPADRAAAAMQIFGRSGLSLLPTMANGSAGLQAAAEEAEKLGIVFNRVDAAKVEAANDAITKLGQLFVGIANQIAIQLSPFVTDLINRIIAVGTSGNGMASMVATAIDWIIKGLGFVADWGIRPLMIGFAAIGWLFMKSAEGITWSIDKIGQGFVNLANLLPWVNLQWTNMFADMSAGAARLADQLKVTLAENIIAPPPSQAINAYVAGVRKMAEKSAQAVADAAPGNAIGSISDNLSTAAAKKIELPKALIAGSSAAISFENQQRFGGGIEQQGLDVAKAQLAEAKATRKAIENLGDDAEEVVDF